MKRKNRIYGFCLWTFLLLAMWLLLITVQAKSESEGSAADDISDTLTYEICMNERLQIPPDGQPRSFLFTPSANNIFSFQSFGNGSAIAKLYQEEEQEPLLSANGFSFDFRLIAGVQYRLVVLNEDVAEPCEVEIMRATTGRCFSSPIDLEDLSQGYEKVIARAYDTHWYRFHISRTGEYILESTSQIDTVVYLLDAAGNVLDALDNLSVPSGENLRITRKLEAGNDYILRICGREDTTGNYRLLLLGPDISSVLPEKIVFDTKNSHLNINESQDLTWTISPADALPDVILTSSDPDIVSVNANGRITAVSSGTCIITARTVNALEASCKVTVQAVPVTDILVSDTSIELYEEDTWILYWDILPGNATYSDVTVISSDPSVVSVEEQNTLKARQSGSAVITIAVWDTLSNDSPSSTRRIALSRDIPVNVIGPRTNYRVLLLGLQRFSSGEYRMGAVNTTQGLYDLFSQQLYKRKKASVTMKMDMTRTQALESIEECFADAKDTDISILYINSHGGMKNETAWIRFADDEILTAARLEQALHNIPGKVVLLLDCCESGSFISTKARRDFNGCFVEAFSSNSFTRLASSKYSLLVSTSCEQNSYRLMPAEDATENNSSTIFSRSLCVAGGWDLLGDKKIPYKADIDDDGIVSLWETYLYVHNSVHKFLFDQDATQDVQVFPKGSQLVLFSKE